MSYTFEVRVPVVSTAFRSFKVIADSTETAKAKLLESMTLDELWGSDSKWSPHEDWEDADGHPWSGPPDIFFEYVCRVFDARFDETRFAELMRGDVRIDGREPVIELLDVDDLPDLDAQSD